MIKREEVKLSAATSLLLIGFLVLFFAVDVPFLVGLMSLIFFIVGIMVLLKEDVPIQGA